MKLRRRPQPAENGEETVATSTNDRERLEYSAYADTKPKTGPVVRDSEDEARSVEESDPFVGEAEVTGVTERFTKKKKYVFRIKIVWSDGSVSHSYRGYTEFFDFHCRLLDLFPEEGGQNPAKERIIPYLPGTLSLRHLASMMECSKLISAVYPKNWILCQPTLFS